MPTTLITAAGSAAAPCVIERLRELGHDVVVCDIYPREWNAACASAERYFQAERATDASAYVSQMKEAVGRYGLQYIIPLTDPEVDVLCSRKGEFAAIGCTLCVLDEGAAALCRDKSKTSEAIADLCSVIPTVSAYEWEPREDELPIMMKPTSGRSSEGQFIARSVESYRAALKLRSDYIAQPYISGGIITVDVVRDRFGSARTLARKELLRTSNGLGTTVEIMPRHPLNEVCARIAERVGIVGAVNMEFIEHDGEYYFLEINPRLSGGAGFSAKAGFDIAGLLIKCFDGEPIDGADNIKPMILTREVRQVVTWRG